MGDQDPRVDDRGLAQSREVVAERRRTVALEECAEDGCRRPLAGAPRPQPALLDEGPGPRRGVHLQPGEIGCRDAPGDHQLGSRVIDDGADRAEDRPHPRGVLARQVRLPSPTHEHQVERAVDVDTEPCPTTAVVDRDPGVLIEPARQGVVGREVGHVREHVAGAGDGDDIGRVAVVGEGAWGLRRGGRDQLAAIGVGRERDGPGAQHDQPAVAEVDDQLAEPGPERSMVRRSRHDPGGRRSGGQEPGDVALGGVEARGDDRPCQRTGVAGRICVEDRDVDVGHGDPSRRAGSAVSTTSPATRSTR